MMIDEIFAGPYPYTCFFVLRRLLLLFFIDIAYLIGTVKAASKPLAVISNNIILYTCTN